MSITYLFRSNNSLSSETGWIKVISEHFSFSFNCVSDINISQGSVARRLRYDGIFARHLSAKCVGKLKKFENRSSFGNVRSKNIVARFFLTRCILYKDQLSLTNPRDALHHGERVAKK